MIDFSLVMLVGRNDCVKKPRLLSKCGRRIASARFFRYDAKKKAGVDTPHLRGKVLVESVVGNNSDSLIRKQRSRRMKNKTKRTRSVDQIINLKERYYDLTKKVMIFDDNGIDVPRPDGVDDVEDLSGYFVFDDPQNELHSALFRGRDKHDMTNESDIFICSKLSRRQCREINKKSWKRHMRILDICFKKKPDITRGKNRRAETQRYICFGFRKNPLDNQIGSYCYKKSCDEKEQS